MKSRRSQVQNLLREDKSLIRKEGSSTGHGFNMTGNQREGRGQGMEIRMLLHLALGTVWVSLYVFSVRKARSCLEILKSSSQREYVTGKMSNQTEMARF